jgi:long-chain acyl-CoA synthetase
VNVAELPREHAARGAAPIALRSGNRRVSFAELDAASGHVADLLLRDGLRPGDRVALLLPNVPEFAAAYYGVLRAGGIAVPLDPLLTRTEVGRILQDAGAGRLLVWQALERAAPASGGLAVFVLVPGSFFDIANDAIWDPPVPVDPDDTAAILYTSGTTGRPRGVELSHANLAGNAAATAERLRFRAGDVVLAALPLCHVFGQTCGLNAVIASGACLVMVQSMEPGRLLALLGGGDVDVMLATPNAYAGLLAADRAQLLQRVAPRTAVSGGAPLDGALHAAWERTTGTSLAEGYGLTETSPVVCLDAPDATRRPGSIGWPLVGVQMRVVDGAGVDVATGETGELVVRGPNVMKGYWRRPAETAAVLSADGWLRTGDLARRGQDGRYEIAGRAKDLIITEGYNVHPREVEEAITAHPAIREAAVLGVPHPLLGEEIVACAVLRENSECSNQALMSHLVELLAPYKLPRRLWFVAALPRTATGKVVKHRIVVPVGADQDADPPVRT